jgi:hypothetical protein
MSENSSSKKSEEQTGHKDKGLDRDLQQSVRLTKHISSKNIPLANF